MTILNSNGQPYIQEKSVSPLSDSLLAFANGKSYFMDTGSYNYYSKHSVIFRGIDFLASLGARLPVQIYKGDKLVEDGRFDNKFDLRYPNPNMSLNEIMYQCLINYLYAGEAFIFFDPDYNILRPLSPKKMTNYNGQWTYNDGSYRSDIDSDTLIYIKRYNPDNIMQDYQDRGISLIDVIREDLQNDLSAQAYNTKYFQNFGKVGGFFRANKDAQIKQEVMDRFKAQYEQIHGSANNAFKILSLPAGIEYQEMSQTMREMEYLESRRDIRDKILMTLGIHKAVLGLNETANRSVTEEAVRTIWLHTLQPILTMFQEKINQQFFNRYYPGYKMYWDYSSVSELKQSMDTILSQAEKFRNLGYTTNEINKYFDLGMPEITDPIGDMRFLPQGMYAVDMLDDQSEQIDTAPIEEPKSLQIFFTKQENNDEKEEKQAISHSKYIKKYDKLSRSLEKTFAGKLSKFFSQELGLVIKHILSQKSTKASDSNKLLLGLFDLLKTHASDKLGDILEPIYNEASVGSDALSLELLGDTATPIASVTVVKTMTNKIKNIANHTYRLIKTQITNGIEAGETTDEISKRIKNVYKMSPTRARLIAQTEIQTVMNQTADERYKEAGVKKKKWLSTDSHTRESHKQNAKLGVVDYDYTYPNGQKTPCDGRGGSAENIGCRCTIVPII